MSRPLAFVVMPVSATKTCTEEEWTGIFKTIFKPTIETLGFDCERATPSSGSLIKSILEQLKAAHLVLADLTDRNPNVFYELGVRHSLRRGTILISQRDEDVPSDLRGYWYVKYGTRSWEVAAFASSIARAVADINGREDRSDSPVGDFLGIEQLGVLSIVHRENAKRLLALKTEITGNLLELEGDHDSLGATHLQDDCLGLLLSTLYVDLGPRVLKRAYELRWKLRMLMMAPFKFGTNYVVAAEAMEDAQWLLTEIEGALQRLQSGTFAEPSAPSSMVWIREPLTTPSPSCLPGEDLRRLNALFKQAIQQPPQPTTVPFDSEKILATTSDALAQDARRACASVASPVRSNGNLEQGPTTDPAKPYDRTGEPKPDSKGSAD